MTLLHRLAIFWSGPGKQEENKNYSSFKTGVFVFLCLFTTLVFTLLFLKENSRWNGAEPTIGIPSTDWHFLDSSTELGCGISGSEKHCAAAMANPSLWNSKILRLLPNGKIPRRQKRDFWLGATISDLGMAKANHANQLILGWFFGGHEVWINGEKIFSSIATSHHPTVITLPLKLIQESAELKIAVLVHPDSENGTPDRLAAPWSEGLATAEQVQAFLGAAEFRSHIRPFALFLLNGLLAVLFFLLWRVRIVRQEYFYLSVFCFIGAVVQLKLTSFYHGVFSAQVARIFDVFLYSSEGSIGILLSLSYSRARKEIFQWAVPVLLLSPWVTFFCAYLFKVNYFSAHQFSKLIPFWYFVGASFCLFQALHLQTQLNSHVSKRRIQSLVFFSLGMVAVGTIYGLQIHEWVVQVPEIISSRFAHFIVVFVLGVAALRDYREEVEMVEKTPVTKYHKQLPLSESLNGAILILDIKKAERLFRMGAKIKKGNSPVETCLSHFCAAAFTNKGTVLETEGDQITIFFDSQDVADPVLAAVRTTEAIRQALFALESQFNRIGQLPNPELGLNFRAGIAAGSIRPIWHDLHGTRLPAWTETNSTNPFVDAARLMEMERKLVNYAIESVVILPANVLTEELQTAAGKDNWVFTNKSMAGKHERIYSVAAYLPGKNLPASSVKVA